MLSFLEGKVAQVAAIIAGAGLIMLAIAFFLQGQALKERTLERDTVLAQLDAEKTAHLGTVANFRAATAEAEKRAAKNVQRVQAEQQAITQEITNDYQAKLADARARADALRVRLAGSTASRVRSSGTTTVPGASDAPGEFNGAAEETGLPVWTVEDALVATEQAIQLEALQRWVREQAAVPVQPIGD